MNRTRFACLGLVAILLTYTVPLPAQQQLPRIPPAAETKLLTGPELEALFKADDELEKKITALQGLLRESEAAGHPVVERRAELADLQDQQRALQQLRPDDPLLGFLASLTGPGGAFEQITQLSTDMPAGNRGLENVKRLVDFLYYDTGSAEANYRLECHALSAISRAATDPTLDEGARSLLRDGLLEYNAGGGGLASPRMIAALADSVSLVSGIDDEEVAKCLITLRDEAELVTVALHRQDERESCARSFVRLLDGREDWLSLTSSTAIPEDSKHAARRALSSPHIRLDDVKLIAVLPTNDSEGRFENADRIRLILLTYRTILKKPPGTVEPKTIAFIDEHLLGLARDPKKLMTERLWDLWGRAAGSLGARASAQTQRYVSERLKAEPDKAIQKALETARRAFRAPPIRTGRFSGQEPLASDPHAAAAK